VRSDEVACVARAGGEAVVGALAGILALAPVGAAVGAEVFLGVVPAARLALAQVLGIRRRRFERRGLCLALPAGVARMGARDRKREPEEAARILLRELGHVERVAVPAVRLALRQVDRLAPEVAADAAQLALPVELVHLQELADVAVVDAKRGYAHGAHVD